MSFKVKDLSVSLSLSLEDASTCTTLTKPTGGETLPFGGLLVHQEGARRNLAVLKTQLRRAMTRS